MTSVNNADGNPTDAAKAAARAHNVPTRVVELPIDKLFGCVWLSCSERFDTAGEAEAHVAEHDKRLGYKPYAYCCDECSHNDALEAQQSQ